MNSTQYIPIPFADMNIQKNVVYQKTDTYEYLPSLNSSQLVRQINEDNIHGLKVYMLPR